jgi:hypothetical protein
MMPPQYSCSANMAHMRPWMRRSKRGVYLLTISKRYEQPVDISGGGGVRHMLHHRQHHDGKVHVAARVQPHGSEGSLRRHAKAWDGRADAALCQAVPRQVLHKRTRLSAACTRHGGRQLNWGLGFN